MRTSIHNKPAKIFVQVQLIGTKTKPIIPPLPVPWSVIVFQKGCHVQIMLKKLMYAYKFKTKDL